MTDVELQALTVIATHENICKESDLKRYGELQFDPWTPTIKALNEELTKRGITQWPTT